MASPLPRGRDSFSVENRLYLVEQELEVLKLAFREATASQERRFVEMTTAMRKGQQVAVGILVAVATSSIFLAINLVVQAGGN